MGVCVVRFTTKTESAVPAVSSMFAECVMARRQRLTFMVYVVQPNWMHKCVPLCSFQFAYRELADWCLQGLCCYTGLDAWGACTQQESTRKAMIFTTLLSPNNVASFMELVLVAVGTDTEIFDIQLIDRTPSLLALPKGQRRLQETSPCTENTDSHWSVLHACRQI